MAQAGPFGSGAFGTSVYSPSPLFNSKTLIDSVLQATGHSNPATETAKRRVCLDALNNRYAMMTAGKHWNFLYSEVDFRIVGPWELGTITAVNGSDQVVGLLTDWDANLLPLGRIYIGGDDSTYNISSISSPTELTLETKFSGNDVVGANYKIVTAKYAMPSDLENVQSIVIDSAVGKVQLIGTQEMARLQARDPQAIGVPRYATLTARRAQDGIRTLEFWPAPDRTYNVHIDYGVHIQKLDDTEDTWTLIPDRYRYGLYWGVLADMYRYLRDPSNMQSAEAQFQKAVLDMANDTQLTDSRLRFLPARRAGGWRSRRYRTFKSLYDFSRED